MYNKVDFIFDTYHILLNKEYVCGCMYKIMCGHICCIRNGLVEAIVKLDDKGQVIHHSYYRNDVEVRLSVSAFRQAYYRGTLCYIKDNIVYNLNRGCDI